MDYRDYLPVLRNGYDMLCAMHPPDPELGKLVREGLLHLTRNHADFDACLDGQAFFTNHFLRLLTTLPLPDEGHWLELFEDLALIMREKALRCGKPAGAGIERRILEHFESCGLWEPDDDRLVSQWYWYRLPLRANVAGVARKSGGKRRGVAPAPYEGSGHRPRPARI